MSEALPFALLVFLAVLLAAMPWHRPHPNHQFMLDLLQVLGDDEQVKSSDPSLTHPQSTNSKQLRSFPPSESNHSAGRGS